MTRPAYMSEPWFAVFLAAVKARGGKQLAVELDVSQGLVSNVRNGSGHYGTGKASTASFAARVIERLGGLSWECPHLTEHNFRRQVMVTLEQCRNYAHSPFQMWPSERMQHWGACQKCPNKARSAPPPPPAPEAPSRKGRTRKPARETRNA